MLTLILTLTLTLTFSANPDLLRAHSAPVRLLVISEPPPLIWEPSRGTPGGRTGPSPHPTSYPN